MEVGFLTGVTLLEIIKVIGPLAAPIATIIVALIQNRKKNEEYMNAKFKELKEHNDSQIIEMKTQISDVKDDVKTLSTTLENHIAENESDTAKQVRVRILQFDDELCDFNHPWPSYGSFEQALIDCSDYIKYCERHENFVNNIADDAIKSIEVKNRYVKDHGLYGKPKEKDD